MLVPGIQQSDSAMHTYTKLNHFHILFHYRLLQGIEYSSLSCPVSQMMEFVASHFSRLAMVWTSFGPMSFLSTDYAFALYLVLQGLRVCHRASLEGSQHLGMACLFSSLPFLGLGLPLLFCYKRHWWLSGPFHLKRQQGSAAVAVVTLSWCLMHIGTGICPLKITCPS